MEVLGQEYMNTAEAAKKLCVSVPTLYRYKAKGMITFTKMKRPSGGYRILYTLADLKKLLHADEPQIITESNYSGI